MYISFCVKVTWTTNALGIEHTQKRTINSSRFSQRLMLPHEDLANCFSLENFKRNMYGTPFYFRNGSRSASTQPGKYSRRGKAWGQKRNFAPSCVRLTVAGGWCWFVMREQYCWLAGSWCWFSMREQYCWLVGWQAKRTQQIISPKLLVILADWLWTVERFNSDHVLC